ncbi:MAG: thioredoxin family protein [Alphaproteobacteria bacterium]|nr:thioredoxin family protein [Alphaproteobacteria bacterium]
MSKKLAYLALALVFAPIVLGMAALPVLASAEVGKPAPDFKATDIHGHEFKLSEQKGKTVVLEWTNNECPFVKKHYGSGNMQATQKQATDKGVVWVSIVSSAPGKQGNVTPEQAIEIEKEVGAHDTARILDESGEIGHMYGAKTTPHMFVIDPEGKLAYAGAIDDQPSPDPETVKTATNYVLAAVNDLSEGHEVATPVTTPYGCGVKY